MNIYSSIHIYMFNMTQKTLQHFQETHTKKIKQENQEIPDDLSIHKLLDEQRKNEDLR